MTPMGQLINSVQEAVNDSGEGATQRIRNLLQEFYFDFCKLHDWQALRRVKNLSFTGATSSGVLLPGNLAGVKEVSDSDGGTYFMQEAGDNQLVDGRRHAYYSQEAVTALEDRKALSINQDAAVFSVSPALSAACAGEFIRFGSEPGCYEISAANTLAAAYRGPMLQSAWFQIRPPTTKRLVLRDEAGELANPTPATVNVYYWIIPEPLYQDDQLILLPHTAALTMKVQATYFLRYDSAGASKYKTIMADFPDAWQDALNADPKFMRPATARDKNGNRIAFGRQR